MVKKKPSAMPADVPVPPATAPDPPSAAKPPAGAQKALFTPEQLPPGTFMIVAKRPDGTEYSAICPFATTDQYVVETVRHVQHICESAAG